VSYTFEIEVYAADPICAVEAAERGVRNNLRAYRSGSRTYEVRIAPGEDPEEERIDGRDEEGGTGEGAVHPCAGEYIG
jgi:hypothetical protein